MVRTTAKLLLIESRDAARELLADHFRAMDYEVIEAHSLAEATMCLQSVHVELAVVSLQAGPSPVDLAGALRGAQRVVFLGPRELVDRLAGSASAFSEPLDLDELGRYCRPSGTA
jgi:DNA-binding response OmpR family regulator